MNKHTRPPVSPDLLSRFAAIVGDKYTVTDTAALEPFVTEPRALYHGNTPMVLRPGSVAEVSAILKLANETQTPVVPQGGNTGMVGGQVPLGGEIVIALTRLNTIREVDHASNTMTCEAGVVLAKAQEAAANVNRLFPLSLGAEGSCTIGGNLSTNAGGTGAPWRLRRRARSRTLVLKWCWPTAASWHGLNKLKKDNTGYDLRHLCSSAPKARSASSPPRSLKLFPKSARRRNGFHRASPLRRRCA